MASRHKELYQDYESVIFQVGQTLYKLRRALFMVSPFFKALFSLPPTSEGREGTMDDRPIKLEGISEFEFEEFSRILTSS